MTTSRRAVVIDDEPDLCRYIESILQDHGFETQTATDARTGEDLILADPPDLICVDLMMPGRTGIQLFARLKKNEATRRIPLIMITGIKEKLNIDWAEIVQEYKVRRPEGFVHKPIDPVRLMRVVESVLENPTEEVQIG